MPIDSAFLQLPQSVSIMAPHFDVHQVSTARGCRIDMQARAVARKRPPGSRTPALRRRPPSCPVAASPRVRGARKRPPFSTAAASAVSAGWMQPICPSLGVLLSLHVGAGAALAAVPVAAVAVTALSARHGRFGSLPCPRHRRNPCCGIRPIVTTAMTFRLPSSAPWRRLLAPGLHTSRHRA